jgi:Domain of unknown function (DUF4440)
MTGRSVDGHAPNNQIRKMIDATGNVFNLLDEFYACVSFAAGDKPDYAGLRALFAPQARLIHVKPDGVDLMGVEDFIARLRRRIKAQQLQSLEQKEIAHEIERFGNIAHVFSTFEIRHDTDSSGPVQRGINSVQFLRRAGRWQIASLMWDEERPDDPIPLWYLPSSNT